MASPIAAVVFTALILATTSNGMEFTENTHFAITINCGNKEINLTDPGFAKVKNETELQILIEKKMKEALESDACKNLISEDTEGVCQPPTDEPSSTSAVSTTTTTTEPTPTFHATGTSTEQEAAPPSTSTMSTTAHVTEATPPTSTELQTDPAMTTTTEKTASFPVDLNVTDDEIQSTSAPETATKEKNFSKERSSNATCALETEEVTNPENERVYHCSNATIKFIDCGNATVEPVHNPKNKSSDDGNWVFVDLKTMKSLTMVCGLCPLPEEFSCLKTKNTEEQIQSCTLGTVFKFLRRLATACPRAFWLNVTSDINYTVKCNQCL